MYKIAVFPEQLEAFAGQLEGFKKAVISECEHLQQQADAIRSFVDETTGLALARPVKEIVGIVTEKEDSLKELINNAYAYAGAVRNIQRMIASKKEHQNTLREKTCGLVCSAVMHEHIKAADSEFQTVDGYMIGKTKSIVDGVASVVEAISGVAIKPRLVTTDEANIDGQVDNAIKLIDVQIALKHPQKVIDRSGTSIPQEQIDSHTLVIDNSSEPWKNSNED